MNLDSVKKIPFLFSILVAAYLIGLMHRGFSTNYDDGFSASIGIISGMIAIIIAITFAFVTKKMKQNKPEPSKKNTKLKLNEKWDF